MDYIGAVQAGRGKAQYDDVGFGRNRHRQRGPTVARLADQFQFASNSSIGL